MRLVKMLLARNKDWNVIAVEWTPEPKSNNYSKYAATTRVVGRQLANFLSKAWFISFMILWDQIFRSFLCFSLWVHSQKIQLM